MDEALAAGHDVMLELDVHGALAVREKIPDALLVFVRAPSREEQRRRLEARGADEPEAIERRLARAGVRGADRPRAVRRADRERRRRTGRRRARCYRGGSPEWRPLRRSPCTSSQEN